MQENEPVVDSLEDLGLDGDYSIFENQGEVAENIKKSGAAIGIETPGIDKIKDGKPLEFMVAKKNCKQCWGRGTVDYIPNEVKTKRSTTRPENVDERRSRIQKALCSCVRIQME